MTLHTLRELLRHFVSEGRWFLLPLLVVLLAAAVLLVLTQGIAVVGPLVYPLF